MPELIGALSPLDGRDPVTIEWIARRLREDGVLPNNGRGRAPADVSTADAVNMLLALNGADNVRDVARHVAWFRQLVPDERHNFHRFPKSTADRLAAPLIAAPTFGQAIEHLVDHCWLYAALLSLSVPEKVRQERWRSASIFGSVLNVEMVRLGASPAQGRIIIRINGVSMFERHYVMRAEWRDDPEYPSMGSIDRWNTARIGIDTIVAVAVALRPDDGNA